MTNEHVIGQWISTLLRPDPKMPPVQHAVYSWGELQRSWSANKFDTRVKVCEPCNNGWMSGLENEVGKPILSPLILGAEYASLTAYDQIGISSWACKLAMAFEFVSERGRDVFFTASERREFKDELLPPNIVVWLAQYVGDGAAHFRSVNRDIENFEDGRKYRLLATTLSVGRLAFQLVAIRNDAGELVRPIALNGLRPHPIWRDATVRIWPASKKPVRFPPVVTLNELRTLGARWNAFGKSTTSMQSR
jgi:hypothetical protein